MASMQNNLQTSFCGMSLSSPIILLSGCVGFGEEYTRIKGFSNADIGAVCLKGTTLEPRLGNKLHRLAETPNGMLNSIGLQNPGTKTVIDEIMPGLDKNETKFIINISGSSVEEYGEIAKHFDNTDIDAIEINISCPNVKEGGVAFGNHSIMHGFMLSKVLDDRLVGWHSEVRKNVLLNLLHNYTYQHKVPGKNNKWLM